MLRWMGAVQAILSFAYLAWLPSPLAAEGMALPGRKPRASARAKTSRPIPKVDFRDIAAQAGLTFRHVGGDAGAKTFIPETVGSGVAIFDYDNDGLPDIFLVNGTKWSYEKEEVRATSRLFHNLGQLQFADVTAGAGLAREGWGQGVCVGDVDNDGFDDLFVTYLGHNVLYRNQGDGTFQDVTRQAGLAKAGSRWGTGCAFFDYDRDGELDLAVANYLVFQRESAPKPGDSHFCVYKGLHVLCGPRGFPGESNLLYRNLGGGKFVDVSEESGFSGPTGRYGFSVLTGDFNNDGWTDVYIACDSTPSVFYRNNRDGTFTDIGIESGTALNEDGQEQAGMGVDAADFDHDGLLDIIKTNFTEDTASLFQNTGNGFFTDVTYLSGLGVNTTFVGWGVGFLDVDQDGWEDILMVNGHVYPSVDRLDLGSPYRQHKIVYWNLRNGAFLDISDRAGPAIAASQASRGAAFGDLDNDGSIEVVVNNLDSRPSLLVNRGDKMNWLLVKTQGSTSNRNGIGARVTLTAGPLKQVQEVRSGGSFLSHNDLRLHFGLGEQPRADRIEVQWLGGKKETFGPFKANRLVFLQEGHGAALQPADPASPPEGDKPVPKLDGTRPSDVATGTQDLDN